MSRRLSKIPADLVILLVAFFTETATDEQKDKLDEWICASDDNMRFFEMCVEQNCQPVIHNPDFDEYELGFPPIVHN